MHTQLTALVFSITQDRPATRGCHGYSRWPTDRHSGSPCGGRTRQAVRTRDHNLLRLRRAGQ